ncbi:MAG TPA: hypothetical protein DD861_14245 [Erythrobacter sp.]|nr:hypothetical protein [Erythrobacter sp.]
MAGTGRFIGIRPCDIDIVFRCDGTDGEWIDTHEVRAPVSPVAKDRKGPLFARIYVRVSERDHSTDTWPSDRCQRIGALVDQVQHIDTGRDVIFWLIGEVMARERNIAVRLELDAEGADRPDRLRFLAVVPAVNERERHHPLGVL